jgi:PAS domain S-box-containing protein
MTVSPPASRPAARWPNRRLQALLDGLSDAVMATDLTGRVIYANAAAETLLDWPRGELLGISVAELFPSRFQDWLGEDFAAFVVERLPLLAGRAQPGTLVRRSGAELPVEVTVDVAPAGAGTSVVVGIVRQRRAERLTVWSELTQRLFDTLADAGTGPSEVRILDALGTELGWEVTTLWSLDPSGELIRRAIWSDPVSDPEGRLRQARPERAREGATLPLHALESGQPFCVSDLRADPRHSGGPAAHSGLRGAVIFPVRYAGVVVGVVELMSTGVREPDAELVELVEAVSGPVGQLLVALERADEREQLVAELEQSRRDQAFLLDASRVMVEAADYHDTLERMAELAVPRLADLCIIDVLDQHGRFRRLACQHHDPTKADLVRELHHDFPPDPLGQHPSVDVVQHHRSRWSPQMSDEFLRQTTRNQRHYEVVKALGFTSYIAVPLAADGMAIGSVTLISAGSGRRFDERDVASAEQLAVQVGSVVGRARRHEREHRIAHTLQQSLLPDQLPPVPGLELAARYEPGSDYTEVGGDWYDVVALGDRVALVVGDVEGHDMRAASVMAKLRHGLSAVLTETGSPSEALARLDRFAIMTGTERMATVLIVIVDTGSGRLTMASAGHPPPVVLRDGRAELVTVPVVPPVGSRVSDRASPSREVTLTVPGGSVLLYTDGLIEHRRRDVATGLRQLVDSVSTGPVDAAGLCDHAVAAMLADHDQLDDVVLLAARLCD